jgi:hypothetical protein
MSAVVLAQLSRAMGRRGQQNCYVPVNTGLRFSMNAARPSL